MDIDILHTLIYNPQVCLTMRVYIMKINAIQNNGVICSPRKMNKKISNQIPTNTNGTVATDTVSFKGKGAIKGAGIGAIFGVGALSAITLLSGGLAAPAAYLAYGAIFGSLGGAVGKSVDKYNDEQKKFKK